MPYHSFSLDARSFAAFYFFSTKEAYIAAMRPTRSTEQTIIIATTQPERDLLSDTPPSLDGAPPPKPDVDGAS